MFRPREAARVVLVAEPTPRRTRWERVLSEGDFQVEVHHNDASAVEALQLRRPDALVFDFWSPVVDGRAIVHRARSVHRHAIGLVAVSDAPEVSDWCRRVGGVRYVHGDAPPEQVLAAVSLAIEDCTSAPVDPPNSRKLRIARTVLLVGPTAWTLVARSAIARALPTLQVASLTAHADALRALHTIAFDAVVALRSPGVERLAETALGVSCDERHIAWIALCPADQEPCAPSSKPTPTWLDDLRNVVERSVDAACPASQALPS